MTFASDLVWRWNHKSSQDPDEKNWNGETHGEPDVQGFAVVLSNTTGLERQDDDHQDQKDDVEHSKQLLLKCDVATVEMF